ncbi:hypothetical protein [Brachybacterium squillarum]|uniref:hypothetical protein n=1 Tax=Brachybacterium squillarum TaxID=661979 RepID=UPI002222BAB8|nr:hypothetical protein [Brachybacterium squillarum]MCW1804359.1 hypothetical protein [Brachybacterium squillarum]
MERIKYGSPFEALFVISDPNVAAALIAPLGTAGIVARTYEKIKVEGLRQKGMTERAHIRHGTEDGYSGKVPPQLECQLRKERDAGGGDGAPEATAYGPADLGQLVQRPIALIRDVMGRGGM